MKEETTEDKIIKAAEEELLSNGYDGARMRSIAEKAKINKGLLHYYFKSKDALFRLVFKKVFQEIFSSLTKAFDSDMPLFDKIEIAVNQFSDFIAKHPRLPFFILSEMNKNAEKHMERMRQANAEPPFLTLQNEIESNKKTGVVRSDYESKQFLLNMMSLILFPFIAKPMVLYMHDLSQKEYTELLRSRKKLITNILIQDIKAH